MHVLIMLLRFIQVCQVNNYGDCYDICNILTYLSDHLKEEVVSAEGGGVLLLEDGVDDEGVEEEGEVWVDP